MEGELEGSYLSMFSRANIGLFATRDCFLRFSMEDFFAQVTGGMSRSGLFSEPNRVGDMLSLPPQNGRGDLNGDASNGDESRLTIIFYEKSAKVSCLGKV